MARLYVNRVVLFVVCNRLAFLSPQSPSCESEIPATEMVDDTPSGIPAESSVLSVDAETLPTSVKANGNGKVYMCSSLSLWRMPRIEAGAPRSGIEGESVTPDTDAEVYAARGGVIKGKEDRDGVDERRGVAVTVTVALVGVLSPALEC